MGSQCDTDTSPDLTEQVENKLSKMNQQTSAAVVSRAEAEMEVVVNNEDYDPYVIVVLNQLYKENTRYRTFHDDQDAFRQPRDLHTVRDIYFAGYQNLETVAFLEYIELRLILNKHDFL